jgi:ABC-2 type transport system ATP-binding protein
VFFSTHIMQEVEAVCNRAIIINKGRLVEDGSPAELKSRAAEKGRVVARLRGVEKSEAESAFGAAPDLGAVSVTEHADRGLLECTLQVSANGQTATAAEINRSGERLFSLAREKGWSVLEMHSEGVSLEDVFLQASRPGVAAPDGAESKHT